MKVLGFRSDPNSPRYAVVNKNGGVFTLLNAHGDNKLSLPASISGDADASLLEWMYREVNAILDAHPDIAKVIIKQNEFTQQDSKAKRRSAHYDAAVILACAYRRIPVEVRIYGSMATKSSNTKERAEKRVGRTTKYWDTKMADAVNAAWRGLGGV